MFHSHKVAQLLAHPDPNNRQLGEWLALSERQHASTNQEFWQILQQTYFLTALKAWELAFWRQPDVDFFDKAALDQYFQAHFEGLAGINLEIPLPLRLVYAYEQLENDSYSPPQGLYSAENPKITHSRRIYKEENLEIPLLQAFNILAAAQIKAQNYAQLPNERPNCYRADLFPPQSLSNGLSRQGLKDIYTHFNSVFSRQKALQCQKCQNIGHNQFTRCHWRTLWLSQALATVGNVYLTEDGNDYYELEPALNLYFDGLWGYSTSSGALDNPNPLDAADNEQFLIGFNSFLTPLVALQKEENTPFSFSQNTYLDGETLPPINKGFAAAIHLRQT